MSGSLLVLSGNEDFLRRRELDTYVSSATRQKMPVVWVSALEISRLDQALYVSPFLPPTETMVVVSEAAKLEERQLSLILAKPQLFHTLLLVEGKLDKRTKFYKAIKKAKVRMIEHNRVALYQQAERAASFVVEDLQQHGKIISQDLARALADLAGNDLGFLSQEVTKLVEYLDAEGRSKAGTKDLVAVVSTSNLIDLQPLSDDLKVKRLKALAGRFRRIKERQAGDPTIRVVRFLAPVVERWLCVSHLKEQGLGVDAVAERLGLKLYYVKKSLWPVTRRWSCQDLKKLVHTLATAEQRVFEGSVYPWVYFSSSILKLVEEASRKPA